MSKYFIGGILLLVCVLMVALSLPGGKAAASLPDGYVYVDQLMPLLQASPTPLPYVVASHVNKNNCADIGITGTVTGPDGLPRGGVAIQYGEVGVPGSAFITLTDYNGRYSGLLLSSQDRAAVQRSHNWYLYVLQNRQPLSPVFEWSSDPIFATNPNRCGSTSDGKQPGCTMDPCRSDRALQVKTVNWRAQY